MVNQVSKHLHRHPVYAAAFREAIDVARVRALAMLSLDGDRGHRGWRMGGASWSANCG